MAADRDLCPPATPCRASSTTRDVLAARDRVGIDAQRAPAGRSRCSTPARGTARHRPNGFAAAPRTIFKPRREVPRCCRACRSRNRRRRESARCVRRPRPTRPAPSATARPGWRHTSSGDMPAAPASSSSIHGRNSPGSSSGKRSSRLPRSPFGSIAIDGNAVDRRFFEEREAQARLAAAGHADANGVRHEVPRVVEDEAHRGTRSDARSYSRPR